MDNTYWAFWEKFLQRNSMSHLVREFLRHAGSVVVLLSPVLVLGTPFIKIFIGGREYQAMAETLGSLDKLEAFTDYLMEAGG